MPELSEIINVPPKRRITIPEGNVAVILPTNLSDEIVAMLLLIRRSKKLSAEEAQQVHSIAGDLLLALIEAVDAQ